MKINHVPYAEIPNFPKDKNNLSDGNFILAQWKNSAPIIIMDRSLQFYKGFSAESSIFPVRTMMLMGVKKILMLNFAGSVNQRFEPGSIMLTEDYINLISDNPFIGQKTDSPGSRYLDMNEALCPEFRKSIYKSAKSSRLKVHQGVFLSVPGPSFPTPAEYRFYNLMGADAVGNSGVFECMAAHQMDRKFACISLINDNCDPYRPDSKNSQKLLQTIREYEGSIIKLLDSLLNH
ncbi:MAG: purine-nucleoside phosphorylase [Bacteroidales bacterium]